MRDLENVSQRHDVKHSQWRHSAANTRLVYLRILAMFTFPADTYKKYQLEN